jgi:hypothetical protein
MEFGNWLLTEKGIEWKGNGINRFVIEKSTLTDTINGDDDEISMYKWIALATEEDWLTEDDLYDLNFVFVYAAAKFGAAFDYQVFDETLNFQYMMLEEEEDEQPGLDNSSQDIADMEQQRKEANSERD